MPSFDCVVWLVGCVAAACVVSTFAGLLICSLRAKSRAGAHLRRSFDARLKAQRAAMRHLSA